MLLLLINILIIQACSPAKKVECFAAFGGCGAICACDFPLCECCVPCLMCVTASVADCCECLFPLWDKCNDQTKDHCVVAYTKSPDPRDWSMCSSPYDFLKVDYEQSIKYTITEITGSGSIECYAYGLATMTDCECHGDKYLYPMGSGLSSVELMTNNDCGTRGMYPCQPRIHCRSNIDIPTVIKWTWTVQPATRCCGYSGLRYNSKAQTCCCDNTWLDRNPLGLSRARKKSRGFFLEHCAVCAFDVCCNDLCCSFPDRCINSVDCGHDRILI